jgi:hypothetical protein
MKALLVLAALIAADAAPPAPPALPAGYAVHQSLPLDQATNGIDGTLQILEDSRITPALRADMWQQTTDLDLVLAEGDPLRADLRKHPLQGAHLRLVDAAGKVVTDQAFDVPLAAIDRQVLHAGPPTYLVSTDHSLGIGSYAGLETRLIEVDHGQLAAEDLPGRTALVSSLKNAWRIVDDPVPGADGKPTMAKVIEVVACHPDWADPAWADKQAFVVELTTYRWDNGWHAQTNASSGYWESDGDWPDNFP